MWLKQRTFLCDFPMPSLLLQYFISFFLPMSTTSNFDNWVEIINPYLNQEIRFVRQFFIGAAVHAQDETLLDRLEVVWMWLNKDPESVEHEYIVIETRDRKEGASRLFILDRMIHKAGAPLDRSLGDENKKKKGIVHLILQKFPWLLYLIPPSRSVTPIPGPSMEAMEEGLLQTSTSISTSTSTSTSSSSLQPPSSSFLFDHQSLPDSDTLSVSATKFAQSLYKGSERASFDRFQGENALFGDRYAFGQNARWLKPKTLTLFELIILAGAVHRFAPEYSTLERNCFWFCNVIFDSVQKVFHDSDSKSPDDSERKTKFTPIDHDTLISGRWKGIKVSDTNEDDISTIIGYFHEGYKTAITEVLESLSKQADAESYASYARFREENQSSTVEWQCRRDALISRRNKFNYSEESE